MVSFDIGNPKKTSEIEKIQIELNKDRESLAELEKKQNKTPLEENLITILRKKIKSSENMIEALYKTQNPPKPPRFRFWISYRHSNFSVLCWMIYLKKLKEKFWN